MTEPRDWTRHLLPLVAAGCVGAALGLIGALYWHEQVRWYRTCVPDEASWFNCIGWWPYHLAVGVPAAVTVVWVVGAAARLRLAALAASGGTALVLLGLGIFESTVAGIQVPPGWFGTVLGSASYLTATGVVLPWTRFWIRLAVLVAFGPVIAVVSLLAN